jgi:cytochrome c heme-lyase
MTDNSHPDSPSEEFESLSSGCPWLNKKNGVRNPIIENVDPRNMMPELPQTKASNQQILLSTDREVSSIPKTGAAGNWEYPSPQQFYHALLRRNKTAEEDSMDSVVFVHNQVNEDSWKQVLEYEKLYEKQCKEPSLQRFVGKSEEPSPKAWMRSKLGLGRGEILFDRHDWFVDRCGLRSVRYIIDYYDTSETPGANPNDFNVRIDTRPALDSFEAVYDRVRKPILDIWKRSTSL